MNESNDLERMEETTSPILSEGVHSPDEDQKTPVDRDAHTVKDDAQDYIFDNSIIITIIIIIITIITTVSSTASVAAAAVIAGTITIIIITITITARAAAGDFHANVCCWLSPVCFWRWLFWLWRFSGSC